MSQNYLANLLSLMNTHQNYVARIACPDCHFLGYSASAYETWGQICYTSLKSLSFKYSQHNQLVILNLSEKSMTKHSIASSHAQEETPRSAVANFYRQSLQILVVSIM